MANKSPDQVVVLIVDDSVERREITRMVLAFAGIRAVVEAASVDQALQTLRDAVIDVVLVECRMAEMDGIEFVRLIRHGHDSFDSRVPIIVQTANPTKALVETARDAGINEFLVRPFSPEQVARHLRVVLNQPREFVEVYGFTGPDRRRSRCSEYDGPDRRSSGV